MQWILVFVVLVFTHYLAGTLSLQYVTGLVISLILAFFCLVVSAFEAFDSNGVSYEVFTLVLGMILGNVGNTPAPIQEPEDLSDNSYSLLGAKQPTSTATVTGWRGWLLAASEKPPGEFYVKIALILLGTRLQALSSLGIGGLLCSWLGCTLVIWVTYQLGKRLLKVSSAHDQGYLIVLCSAVTICGASAATGVYDSIGSSFKRDGTTSAVIATLSLLTFAQVFFVPAVLTRLTSQAWFQGIFIGTTIDSTGFVAAAATALGGEASSLAMTSKIVQNIFIAPASVVLAYIFQDPSDRGKTTAIDTEKGEATAVESKTNEATAVNHSASTSYCHWVCTLAKRILAKVPKFVLGFFLVSSMLTVVEAIDTPFGESTQLYVQGYSQIFFALGFFHLGFSTNLKKLVADLQDPSQPSSTCAVLCKMTSQYAFVQTMDMLIKGLLLYGWTCMNT